MTPRKSTKSLYRVRSRHSENLSDGRIVGPGQEVELALETEHDQALLERGALALVEDREPPADEPKGGATDSSTVSGDGANGEPQD